MITAFILITVPTKRAAEAIEALRKFPQVQEAAAVHGDTDIIAKVQAASLMEIDQVIMENIQGSIDVNTTRTYLVIEKLHWKR